jgi:hypothetical protein
MVRIKLPNVELFCMGKFKTELTERKNSFHRTTQMSSIRNIVTWILAHKGIKHANLHVTIQLKT